MITASCIVIVALSAYMAWVASRMLRVANRSPKQLQLITSRLNASAKRLGAALNQYHIPTPGDYMPADYTTLDQAIAALTDQAAATEGVEQSAITLINGFGEAAKKAVADALTADNAADQNSIDAAMAAITAVTARFAANGNALGSAVATNQPSVPATPTA